MAAPVFTINKGINRPIEFRGLKAQYIWYLGGGLLALLLLFAVLYISGVPSLLCVALVFTLATLLFVYIYRLSRRYGTHGLMKRLARRKIPPALKVYSRRLFIHPGAPCPIILPKGSPLKPRL